jgi:hypothetical protein
MVAYPIGLILLSFSIVSASSDPFRTRKSKAQIVKEGGQKSRVAGHPLNASLCRRKLLTLRNLIRSMREVLHEFLPYLLELSEIPTDISDEALRKLRSKYHRLMNSPQYENLTGRCLKLAHLVDETLDDPFILRFVYTTRERFRQRLATNLKSIAELSNVVPSTASQQPNTISGEASAELIRKSALHLIDGLRRDITRLQKKEIDITAAVEGISGLLDDVSAETLRKNSWFNGSFYLVVFLSAVTVISAVQRYVDPWALPVVLVAGVIVTSVVGALQLRNDDRLSEEGFLKLMGLSLKRVFLVFRGSQVRKQP